MPCFVCCLSGVRCLLLHVVCYLRCLLKDVCCCVLSIVCWLLLSAVCSVLFACFVLSAVECCMLFVVCCALFVVCC